MHIEVAANVMPEDEIFLYGETSREVLGLEKSSLWDECQNVLEFNEVDQNQTYSELLNRSLESWDLYLDETLGFPWNMHGIALNVHGLRFAHVESGKPIALQQVVGVDGQVSWYFDAQLVTVADVVRTRHMGLFSGDPTKVFLITSLPREMSLGGNGLDIALEFMRAASELSGLALGPMAVIGGTWAGIKEMKKVGAVLRRMREKGADSKKLASIAVQSRTTDEVSRLLGIPTPDVPAVLTFLGMSEVGAGVWIPGDTPNKKAIREIAEVLGVASHNLLPTGQLKAALGEIMVRPQGQRAEVAEEVLSKFHNLSFEPPQTSRHIHPSVLGNGDLQLNYYVDEKWVTIGTAVQVSAGHVEVRLPVGGLLSNSAGAPLVFSTIASAIDYLGSADL